MSKTQSVAVRFTEAELGRLLAATLGETPPVGVTATNRGDLDDLDVDSFSRVDVGPFSRALKLLRETDDLRRLSRLAPRLELDGGLRNDLPFACGRRPADGLSECTFDGI